MKVITYPYLCFVLIYLRQITKYIKIRVFVHVPLPFHTVGRQPKAFLFGTVLKTGVIRYT